MNLLKLKPYSILIIFIILGFGIYSNTLDSPFNFDDLARIKSNPDIRIVELTLGNLSKAAFGKKSPHNRPIGNISFALNYYFHKYNLKGYHIVNIIIHVLTGFLLYLFLKTTLSISTARPGYEPSHLIPLFVSLLWLAHPVHTQSVTYIVQRLNSMAAMFFVLSFLLFVYGRLAKTKQKRIFLFIGSALSWILALGCKQNAAPLPFYIFLYEWFFFQDLSWAWFKRRIKFLLGITILFILIGLIFLQHLGHNPWETFTAKFTPEGYTYTEKFMTQFRVVIYYISLFFYPHPARLNLDRDFPLSHSLVDPVTTLLSLCVILTLVGSAIYLSRRERLLSFCIFWFFGNLIIESLIPRANIFEHRTYLPYMLLSVIPVLLVFRYLKFYWLPVGIFLTVSVLFSFWTYERNKVWQDEITLWRDCVNKSPNKARPRANLGLFLTRQGLIDEAIDQFRKGLQIEPEMAEIHLGLGEALAKKGDTDEAIHHYSLALKNRPEYTKAYNNLALLLYDQGKTADAMENYYKALQINPDYPEAHSNLGIALAHQGNTAEAIQHYRKALQIDPDFVEAHNNLGIVLAKEGRGSEAVEHYSKALQIKPDHAEAHLNLGVVQAEQGNIDDAIDHYLTAIRIDPDYMKAHFNLAKVLAQQGKTQEAIRHFFEALRIDPNYAEAHYNLGFVFANMGRAEEAIKHYSEALQIDPKYADAHNNLGAVLLLKGRSEEAVAHLQEALKIKPELADAHINLGVVLINQGKLTEAIYHFQEALRIKPDANDAQNNLKKAMALQRRFDDALARTHEALTRNPNDSELHYQLGTLYQNKGEVDEAIDQFKKAISIQPEFAEAINDLAVMYAVKGEYEKALPLFKRSVGLRPNDLGTYYNISRLYAIQNNIEESINWLKKAVEKGFADWKRLKTDESFENIRESIQYKKLIEKN